MILPLVAALSIPRSESQQPLILSISADKEFLLLLREGYKKGPWTKSLIGAQPSMDNLKEVDGLWFLDERLIVPNNGSLRETLFRLAHDNLGHFGFDKSYKALQNSYYWPRMRRDLESAYVPSCVDCQRNKSSTTKPIGPLHPLPVPDGRCNSVAMDFIGPLPPDEGHDCILTLTDRLGSEVQLVPCSTSQTADELASTFFTNWYCKHGLPLEIICDRDKLFISQFWQALHKLTGVKLKMSTSYHPETDGSSERTNKTVNQCVRFHVEHHQKGWVHALPIIRFNFMNTVNKSTGFTPFQLQMGRSPRVMPPLTTVAGDATPTDVLARQIIERMQTDTLEARDNLAKAKISQSYQANKTRTLTFPFRVGDRVRLSTLHRRKEFKVSGQIRAAKFMPRYDGPYTITATNKSKSTVTLDLPPTSKAYPVFHTSEVLPYRKNDAMLFPAREFSKPPPVLGEDGDEEYLVRDIIDERRSGRGYKYLVRWVGYRPEEDRWLPR